MKIWMRCSPQDTVVAGASISLYGLKTTFILLAHMMALTFLLALIDIPQPMSIPLMEFKICLDWHTLS